MTSGGGTSSRSAINSLIELTCHISRIKHWLANEGRQMKDLGGESGLDVDQT